MRSKNSFVRAFVALFVCASMLLSAVPARPGLAQQDLNPNPPAQPVKLIFIHHSTGENWLADENGGLGLALAENNYFVSDTNYGWGPEGVGDRTDIPNWLEWFRSENTPAYEEAFYNESGQNSSYTRLFDDPGGENQVILFKSCFPNSNLDGSPDDPPSEGSDYTVGNAKYVYNEILQYFATRPDKLFVVITAPPVTDPTYAENARAFNQWLVNDWLAENNYTTPNVAVFDFYTILTGPDGHHRFTGGDIEHTFTPGQDTSFYPSDPNGDDHPSQAGNLKATEEFLPMLNIFYNRWVAQAPVAPPADTQPLEPPPPAGDQTQPGGPAEPPIAPVAGAPGLIEGFEGAAPAGTNGWEVYWDEATTTRLDCAPASGTAYSGAAALQMDFDVAANSWGTCTLFYDPPLDLSAGQGILFLVHASQAGLNFDVDLYAGSWDDQETYPYTIEVPPEAVDGWVPIALTWDQFFRASWEADAGTPFSSQGRILGLGFGLGTFPDTPNTGTLWFDDLQVLGAPPDQPSQPPAEQPAPQATDTVVEQPSGGEDLTGGEEEPETEDDRPGGRLCGGAALVPFGALAMLALRRRRR